MPITDIPVVFFFTLCQNKCNVEVLIPNETFQVIGAENIDLKEPDLC